MASVIVMPPEELRELVFEAVHEAMRTKIKPEA